MIIIYSNVDQFLFMTFRIRISQEIYYFVQLKNKSIMEWVFGNWTRESNSSMWPFESNENSILKWVFGNWTRENPLNYWILFKSYFSWNCLRRVLEWTARGNTIFMLNVAKGKQIYIEKVLNYFFLCQASICASEVLHFQQRENFEIKDDCNIHCV